MLVTNQLKILHNNLKYFKYIHGDIKYIAMYLEKNSFLFSQPFFFLAWLFQYANGNAELTQGYFT